MSAENEAQIYDDEFYKKQMAGSYTTAHTIVAYMVTRFSNYINSVVDFGCGTGAWLSVFQKYGKEIQGYDFGEGAPANLLISPDKFKTLDLTDSSVDTGAYDLALCLEVAEHIPAEESDKLVSRLAASAPFILFSAAIPGQGGVNHVNEQYPSYWIAKFNALNFDCYDMIRPKFWYNRKVMFWYRQNMLLFKNREISVPNIDENARVDLSSNKSIVDIVHPELFAGELRLLRELTQCRS